MKYRTTLFIFRRDFRLEDNTGLIFALKHSEKVIPAFIFSPEQIDNNPFRSDHCLKFMIESLEDLQAQLKEKGGHLFLFKGKPEEVVAKIGREIPLDAVIVNRDYTPYSIERDKKIEKACKVPFLSFDDALLNPPEQTLKKDGQPYSIFTPFFKNALKIEISTPTSNSYSNYYQDQITFAEKNEILSTIKPNILNALKGGRKEALQILKNITPPTHLSPYLKFTVCSPREVYKAFFPHPELVRALYWRDFFTSIAFFFPYVFKSAFHPKFDQIKWSNDKEAFKKWCEGKTGFPIVDAAMREMNATGLMPNRMRMIVASFLVKDLHIDWKWGEKYFAQKLIDYDPAVNNGNWQWAASTGCDAQPYFRIFNPWSQQKKFDPESIYIKKWIPELDSPHYPAPMVDHEIAAKQILNEYKKLYPSG